MRLTNLAWRDGYQSTIDANKPENFRPNPLRGLQLMHASAKAGFTGFEMSGGQHFDNEIKAGRNPFSIMELQHDFFTKRNNKAPIIDPQMLFRGANVLGLTHFNPDVIEHFLNLYIDHGMKKIRSFDALNDIDNLKMPNSVKINAAEKGVVLQGALCFGFYPQASDRYTNPYYVNYANKLVESGFNSIVIKDMSGQLGYDRAKSLVRDLKETLKGKGANGRDVPVELHIHSTNRDRSLGAIKGARESGIDGIETVEGPLKGGSSHHSIDDINAHDLDNPIKLDESAYASLKEISGRIFGDIAKRREDLKISEKDKQALCDIGIPGGAMPFAIRVLENAEAQVIRNNLQYFIKNIDREGYKSEDELITKLGEEKKLRQSPDAQKDTPIWDAAMALFKQELPRVCQDANYPLLVTPTADICYTQAVRNMAYGRGITNKLEGTLIENPWVRGAAQPDSATMKTYYEARYDWTTPDEPGGGTKHTYDPRFIKLILGYYGQMKSYGVNATESNGIYEPKKAEAYFRPSIPMIEFCTDIQSMSDDAKKPVNPEDQIYNLKLEQGAKSMPAVKEQVEALIKEYGHKALSFGSRAQLEAMFALFPKETAHAFKNLFVLGNDMKRNKSPSANPIGVVDPFPEYPYIIQPLLDQIQAIIISEKKDILPVENPLAVEIRKLGKVGERMYDVYTRLPSIQLIQSTLGSASSVWNSTSDVFRANVKQLQHFFEETSEGAFKASKEVFLNTRVEDLIKSLTKISSLRDIVNFRNELAEKMQTDIFAQQQNFVHDNHSPKVNAANVLLTQKPVNYLDRVRSYLHTNLHLGA